MHTFHEINQIFNRLDPNKGRQIRPDLCPNLLQRLAYAVVFLAQNFITFLLKILSLFYKCVFFLVKVFFYMCMVKNVESRSRL